MARLPDPELAERRRRQILNAAKACFERRGFHQSTMHEICAEAQISAGALYRYFGSKADIIAAIAQENRRELEGPLTAMRENRAGLLEALTLIFRIFFHHVQGMRGVGIMGDVLGEAARDPALSARLGEIDAASKKRLSEAVALAQMRGEVDAALDPDVAAESIFAIFEGIAFRNAICPVHSPEIMASRARDIVARYLSPRSEPPMSSHPHNKMRPLALERESS